MIVPCVFYFHRLTCWVKMTIFLPIPYEALICAAGLSIIIGAGETTSRAASRSKIRTFALRFKVLKQYINS